MDYTQLTEKDLVALRQERVTQLEGEHFRLSLLIDEAAGEEELTQLGARQQEVARRLDLHLAQGRQDERKDQSPDQVEGTAERT
jgi:hypothetical protein